MEGFNLYMNAKSIIIVASVKLDSENFPCLYKWAQKHPETLAQELRAWGKVHKMEDDLTSVAITLESDMEHENNVAKGFPEP